MTKIRNMRGESVESVTKPGWTQVVDTLPVANAHAFLFMAEDGQNCYQTSKRWSITFHDEIVPGWEIVLTSVGYFLTRHQIILSKPTVRGNVSSIARRLIDQNSVFWRDVIVQFYDSRDPQCEECLSGSPVQHFPFTHGHRIHCTCGPCF